MTSLKGVEPYKRGLEDFQALLPLERDFFVLNDLDIYYEMEGGFTDYLLSGSHDPQLRWLADTLQRIGEANSAEILLRLQHIRNADPEELNRLCDRYYELRHQQWALLKQYLARHNACLDESL